MLSNLTVTQQAIVLGAFTFQAVQKLLNPNRFVLPKKFSLIRTLNGGPGFPAIGYIAQSDQDIIVAFRGTQDVFDRLEDLDLSHAPFPFVSRSGTVVRGFLNLYSLVRSQLLDSLKNLSTKKNLFITGHSLGAALATMSALDIAVNTRFKRPHIFTFASPRVGSSAFVSAFNRTISNSVRIANIFDIIPLLPLGYRHVKTRFCISFLTSGPLGNHILLNYFQALCSMNLSFCERFCRKTPNGFCPDFNPSKVKSKTRRINIRKKIKKSD